jgi:hypothetical protein
MRKDRLQASEDDPLFASPQGLRIDYANIYNRVLKPAMRKAGITSGGAPPAPTHDGDAPDPQRGIS